MSRSSNPPDASNRQALELLRSGQRFLLVGHVRPDGDCLGSQGALARGLIALGKEAHILNPDAPEERYDYLQECVSYGSFGGEALPEHDVVCLLDINELSRCGPLAGPLAAARSKKVVIDHHPPQGEPWWDAAYLDVSASATGILVLRILRELGCAIDTVIAESLFTSLVTDTGWFRYSNTDVETLAAASELVAAGANPARLFGRIYQRRPQSEPLAVGRLLSRAEYFAGGSLVVVDQPLERNPSEALQDGDPVLDLLRSVGDVEVVLYVREIEPGVCKLSARSKTAFDVNALARRFGGGGHVRASGATIRGRLAAVRERLVATALEMLGEEPTMEQAG